MTTPSAPGAIASTKPLRVLIAAPRGFCAGVDRAIEIVERAIGRYGAPVVFSAHGVAKTVPAEATTRGLEWLDATCPLVSKVHRQAERHFLAGRHILFIGHGGHPEVVGTMGQVPEGSITLVETIEDVARIPLLPERPLAFLTQTTLSVDDTAAIVAALRARFPAIAGPRAEDICYATSNRQEAVKAIAGDCDLVLVIGSPNSSNSLRLVEVAERSGARAMLIQRAAEIAPEWLDGIATIGVTAGASAPEVLVREVIDRLGQWRTITSQTVTTAEEHMVFKLPRQLAD
jgi:4-hydroxy-3-methylbut-2-enyl diphosphate reductase